MQTYCQNRKHFKIMAHETVNFRRKNYGIQILSCFFKVIHLLLISKLHNNTINLLHEIKLYLAREKGKH